MSLIEGKELRIPFILATGSQTIIDADVTGVIIPNIASGSTFFGLAPYYLTTASYLPDSASFDARINAINFTESGYVLTQSFNNYTSSVNTQMGNIFISQSNYVLTQSFFQYSASTENTIAQYALTSSVSASVYTLSSITQSFATTGSNTFHGSQTISGSIFTNSDITLTGTLTAQTIHSMYITASTEYSSGSNQLGSKLSDVQSLWGTVYVTGSLIVNSSSAILSNQTSSLSVATASVAPNYVLTSSLSITSGSVLLGGANSSISGSSGLTYINNILTVNGTIQQYAITSSLLKTNNTGALVAAVVGVDYQAALTNPVTGTGSAGQVAVWNGTNTQTGYSGLTFTPTSSLTIVNTVTASSAQARGIIYNGTLTAAANNDVLVGLDVNPVFNNSIYTGVYNIGIRLIQSSGIAIMQNTSTAINLIGGNTAFGGGNGNPTNQLEVWGNSFVNGNLNIQSSNYGNITGYGLNINGTVTPSGGAAYGIVLTPTLTAIANNLELDALNINPTFNVGSYTGATQYWINLIGNGKINGTNQIILSRNGQGILSGLSTFTALSAYAGGYIAFGPNGNSEKARITSTGNLLLQTTTDNAAGILQTAGNIVPSVTNTYSLGTSSYVWSNIYATSQTISGLTAGQVVFTGTGGLLSGNSNFAYNSSTGAFTLNQASDSGKWNLYSSGTASSYHAGNFLLGSNTDDGINVLQVTGSAHFYTKVKIGGASTAPVAILELIAPDGNTNSILLGRYDHSNYWYVNHAGDDFRLWNPNASGSDIMFGIDAAGVVYNNSVLIGTSINNAAGILQSNGNIVPSTTNTYSLGTSSYVWSNIYATSQTISGLTAGSVVFAGTGGVLSQDNSNLFWDNTNKRLGIGTTSPTNILSIVGNLGVTTNNFGPIIRNANSTGYTELKFDNDNAYSGGQGDFVFGYGGSTSANPNQAYFYNRLNAATIFGTNNTTRMTIDGSGNVGIGTPSPASKLDISDVTLAGSGSLAGSILNLAQTWNTTGTPTAIKLNVTNTASSGSTKLLDLQVGGTSAMYVSAAGNLVVQNNISSGSGNVISGGIFQGARSGTLTSGTINVFSQVNNITPTSGTAQYNMYTFTNTINQTGGASGIVRSVYLNPALPSAADYRAIESTNGPVILSDTYAAGSGSLAGSLLNLAQTWNTTGSPTAIKLNITNTASNAASLLMDLQVGGVSKFSVSNTGSNYLAGHLLLNTTTDDGINQVQINGSMYATIIKANSATTSVTGSTSGTAVFTQPNQGTGLKIVMITLTSLLGTASYTFPTAFINTPVVLSTSGLATSIVTTNTTTSCTVTGTTSSGTLILMGT